MKTTSSKNNSPLSLSDVVTDAQRSEIFGWDFITALVSVTAVSVLVLVGHVDRLITVAPVAAGLAGMLVVVAVILIAAMSVCMRPQFLRNLSAIGREPAHYFAPFLATVFLGIGAASLTVVLTAFTSTTPTGLVASVGALAVLLGVWATGSLIRSLNTFVQFVQLLAASADVDEIQ